MKGNFIALIVIGFTSSCASQGELEQRTPNASSAPVLTATPVPTSTSSPATTRTETPIPSPTATPTPAPRVDWVFRGGSAGVPTWDLTENGPGRSDLIAAIDRMKADGLTWYELGTTWFMNSSSSTEIHPIYDSNLFDSGIGGHVLPTISDQRLEEVITIMHENEMQVFLRPNLLINAQRSWRGDVRPTSWDDWFSSYTDFITHYADLAERNQVELFSIGFELNSSVPYVENWNSVIASVRSEFGGPITYDAGGLLFHGNESDYSTQIFSSKWEPVRIGEFAENLDYIGIDWYPQLTNTPDASAEDMAQNVQRIVDQFLVPLWEKYEKPIFFAEIDYSSMDRTSINPLRYRSGGPVDELEQAAAFEAIFLALEDEPWFAGMFPAGFYLTVFQDSIGTSNSLWYKDAEEVFRYWFAGLPRQ